MGKATLEQGWVGGESLLESRIQSWPMRTSICRRKKLLLPFQGGNSTGKRQQWSEQRCQGGITVGTAERARTKEASLLRVQHANSNLG